uniref:Uncharacterized protein n=1 Tax=Arundo donax TaxID=35708 RepID=A0A0A9E6T0_ARUDO
MITLVEESLFSSSKVSGKTDQNASNVKFLTCFGIRAV